MHETANYPALRFDDVYCPAGYQPPSMGASIGRTDSVLTGQSLHDMCLPEYTRQTALLQQALPSCVLTVIPADQCKIVVLFVACQCRCTAC